MVMNGEWVRIWKEEVAAFLKALLHLLGETEENQEKMPG
jgi:hypothetical protein